MNKCVLGVNQLLTKTLTYCHAFCFLLIMIFLLYFCVMLVGYYRYYELNISHHRYLGNPNAALKYFNKARKDQEWGQRAIYSMIEICLNPDNDTIGGETFESVDSEVNQSGARDTLDMAIRTADKLLKVRVLW